MTAPERMFVREKPNGAMGRWHDATSLPETAAMTLDGSNPMRPYILATPEALAASPEVAALIAEARRDGWNPAIEAGCKAAMKAPVFNPTAPQGEINVIVMVMSRVGRAIRALKETTHD